MKIILLTSSLGAGAYYRAIAKAKQGTAPVYHYAIAYDAPLPEHHPQRGQLSKTAKPDSNKGDL